MSYSSDYEFKIALFLVIAVILAVVTLIFVKITGAFPHYSEGERAGQVYKLSYKGMIFKSYEGEMNLGGMAADANGQAIPNRFAFSVKDPEVAKQLNEATISGNRVTLTYHQYFVGPIYLSTDYVVDKIDYIK